MSQCSVILALIVTASSAGADELMVALPHRAVGRAAIADGDDKAAGAAAKREAYVDAIMQGARLADEGLLIEGAALVKDRIFAHAKSYLQSFDVSVDGPDADSRGLHVVELTNVVLKKKELDRDVAAVRAEVARRSHPVICTVVREDISADPHGGAVKTSESNRSDWTKGAVHQSLVQRLTPLGWKFVDAREVPHPVQAASPTSRPASLNGRDFDAAGADYVIVGAVGIQPEVPLGVLKGKIFPVDLRVAFYVKTTDTGDTVASAESTQLVPGHTSLQDATEVAMERAAQMLANVLSRDALARWNTQLAGNGSVTVFARDADYDLVSDLERELKGLLPGIAGVEEVSFSDGTAEVKVTTAGVTSKQLAAALARATKPKVRVVKVSMNAVEVRLDR